MRRNGMIRLVDMKEAAWKLPGVFFKTNRPLAQVLPAPAAI
jgi:hypothetical protein